MQNFFRKGLIFSFGILLIYVIISALLYYNQESFIFKPEKLPDNYEFNYNSDFEEFKIKTKDGKILSCALLKSKKPEKGLIYFLHGNAGSIDGWQNFANNFLESGYDFLLMDYRGFGKSSGEIESESQLLADVELVYKNFEKKYKEKKIGFVGFSIGTFPAAWLAGKFNPDFLLLIGAFYSLEEVILDRYPFVAPFTIRYKFRNAIELSKSKSNIYLAHGIDDQIIPIYHSEKLKKLYPEKIYLKKLKETGHNDIFLKKEFQNYLKKIIEFD